MKDGLGQDIAVGDRVVWVGGKNNYAGVVVREIGKITPKMVRLTPRGCGLGECVGPETVVVINKLIGNYEGALS